MTGKFDRERHIPAQSPVQPSPGPLARIPMVFSFNPAAQSVAILAFALGAQSLAGSLTGVAHSIAHALPLCLVLLGLVMQVRIITPARRGQNKGETAMPDRRGRTALGAVAAVQMTVTLMMAPNLSWLLVALWACGIWAAGLTTPGRRFGAVTGLILVAVFGLYWPGPPLAPDLSDIGAVAFLALTALNGLALAVGGGIRAPLDGQGDQETCSALWELKPALATWLGILLLSGIATITAARAVGVSPLTTALALAPLTVVAGLAAWMLWLRPTPGHGSWVETAAVLWLTISFVLPGLLPSMA